MRVLIGDLKGDLNFGDLGDRILFARRFPSFARWWGDFILGEVTIDVGLPHSFWKLIFRGVPDIFQNIFEAGSYSTVLGLQPFCNQTDTRLAP